MADDNKRFDHREPAARSHLGTQRRASQHPAAGASQRSRRARSSAWACALGLLAASWSVSCVASGPDAAEHTGQIDQAAFLRSGSVHHTISVCWEQASYLQPWIQWAAQQGWAREANIELTGWGTCSSGDADVHMTFWDEDHSHTDYPLIWPLRTYFIIHFQSSMDYHRATYSALHEFGHVLGFEHEQNRSDSTSACAAADGDGDFAVGPYDPYSIMDYCHGPATLAAFGIDRHDRLSGWDVEGLRWLDGAKPKASISSSYGGHCWRSTGSGAKIVDDRCASDATQGWRIAWGAGQAAQTIELESDHGQCVTLTPGGATTAPCAASAAQTFSVFDAGDKTVRGQIRGIAGKCLTRLTQANEYGVGRDVVMETCDGSAEQAWYIDGARGLVYASEQGLCLDVEGGDPTSGTRVQIYPCNGSDAQLWTRQGNGQLQAEGKCLAVFGENQNDGATVGLWDCGSSPYEVWSWHRGMQLRGMGGKCLTSGTAMFGTSAATTNYCDGSTSEWWIYDPHTHQVRSEMGLCLSVTNSFVVTTAVCSSTSLMQRWLVSDGTVFSQYAGACLNVASPDPWPLVNTASCDGSPNQVWNPSGQIEQDGQCLFSSPDLTNVAIGAAACIDSPSYQFDVH